MNSAFLSKFIQIVYCIFENYLYYFSFISDENSVEEEMFCSGFVKPGYKKFSYKNIYDKHTEKLSPTRKWRLSKAKSTPVKVKQQKEEVEIIEITSSPITVSSAEDINTASDELFCVKRELSFSRHQSPSPSSDSSLPSLSPPPKTVDSKVENSIEVRF